MQSGASNQSAQIAVAVWETAASAVTALREWVYNNLQDTRGLLNAAQVIKDASTCVLDCGLGILMENCPERYHVRKVLGARSAPTTGT